MPCPTCGSERVVPLTIRRFENLCGAAKVCADCNEVFLVAQETCLPLPLRKAAVAGWEDIQTTIYESLDCIREHPVINDFLSKDGVDSVTWYRDSGKVLETMVAQLAPAFRRGEGEQKKQKMVTLRVPRKAWDLLAETLAKDAESSAFDRALRRSIKKALEQVSEVGEPYVLATVFRGIPDKVEVFWDREKALRAARKEVESLRADYDALTVARGGEEVYSWPENE